MSSNTITLVLEVTREADDSFSISLEDRAFAGDDRYIDGLSEGYVFDAPDAASQAGLTVSHYLHGVIGRITKPMEFEKSSR